MTRTCFCDIAGPEQTHCGMVAALFYKQGYMMARPGPETMARRRREQAKKEKREAKEEKKALRKAQKNANPEADEL